MNEKYVVKTKMFDDWIRSEIRLIPEGISLSNEYRSILIKYNEVTSLKLNQNLILTVFYTKDDGTQKIFESEQINCSKGLIKLLSRKTKLRIEKTKDTSGLKPDSIVFAGRCKYNDNDNCTYNITHKKFIINIEKKQISFNIENMEKIENIETSGIKFIYGDKSYEIYFPNPEKTIKYIEQNRKYINYYTDKLDTSKTNNVKKPKKIINIFLLIIFIILCFIAYYLYRGI